VNQGPPTHARRMGSSYHGRAALINPNGLPAPFAAAHHPRLLGQASFASLLRSSSLSGRTSKRPHPDPLVCLSCAPRSRSSASRRRNSLSRARREAGEGDSRGQCWRTCPRPGEARQRETSGHQRRQLALARGEAVGEGCSAKRRTPRAVASGRVRAAARRRPISVFFAPPALHRRAVLGLRNDVAGPGAPGTGPTGNALSRITSDRCRLALIRPGEPSSSALRPPPR
jgi:hypothetical protein